MPPAWKQAARALRQPYWDWASGLTPPAEVLQLRQISILQPDGSNRTVDNPLFSYKFADTASSFANVNETFRRPSNLTLTHGRQLARQTYDLLTRVNDWFGFSTNAAGGDSISSSLESIHDDIHGTIGGMMGSVPYSGKPICHFKHIALLPLVSTNTVIVSWTSFRPYLLGKFCSTPMSRSLLILAIIHRMHRVYCSTAPPLQRRQDLRLLAGSSP